MRCRTPPDRRVGVVVGTVWSMVAPLHQAIYFDDGDITAIA
jgi:hypothetical protein